MTFIAGGVGITPGALPAEGEWPRRGVAGFGCTGRPGSRRVRPLTEEVRELVAAIPGAEAVLRNTPLRKAA